MSRSSDEECWELDALSPTVIADLIRTEIEAMIEPNAWAEALAHEAADASYSMPRRGIGPWSKSCSEASRDDQRTPVRARGRRGDAGGRGGPRRVGRLAAAAAAPNPPMRCGKAVMSDNSKILGFPKAEVPLEERARRLKTEIDRLASMPVVEWLYYLATEGVAEKHDVSRPI